MEQRTIPVKELIEGAAKPYLDLWRDGQLKLAALARHYKKKGHPVSGATFSRLFRGEQALGQDVLEATHAVFKIPKNILRGEPMSPDMEKTLMRFQWSTVLLAERLESLPKEDYYHIAQEVERAEEAQRKLKEALATGGVVSIDKHRKK